MTSLYMEGQKAQISRQKCVGCGSCIALCHKQAPYWVHSNTL